jgi:hypothetical protein
MRDRPYQAYSNPRILRFNFCFYRHLIASGVRRITPRWVNLSGAQRRRIALRCRSQQPMRRCP